MDGDDGHHRLDSGSSDEDYVSSDIPRCKFPHLVNVKTLSIYKFSGHQPLYRMGPPWSSGQSHSLPMLCPTPSLFRDFPLASFTLSPPILSRSYFRSFLYTMDLK
ncbi:hypothetical protein TNCV_455021 [Trichonephila clavipes]|nr:hypothetical protein TNCV_455021 [Trichonephila clavipes]